MNLHDGNNDNKNNINSHHGLKPQNQDTRILQAILTDNKNLTKELKLQLDTIEKLQNENESLKKRINELFIESSLCLERDEMNMKRNVALVRENKQLKQRLKDLSIQFDQIDNMKQTFDQQCEDMVWRNNRLDLNVIKLQTDLEECNKEKKWLYDDNKRLKSLISKYSNNSNEEAITAMNEDSSNEN